MRRIQTQDLRVLLSLRARLIHPIAVARVEAAAKGDKRADLCAAQEMALAVHLARNERFFPSGRLRSTDSAKSKQRNKRQEKS